MAISDLTAARVRDLLDYEPLTGSFTWRPRGDRKWDARFSNKAAGSKDTLGYLRIIVDYNKCWAHRLAWLYVHGSWPAVQVDHINGDPLDNRLENLRDATRTTNMENRRFANRKASALPLGVSFDARRKARPFNAALMTGYKKVHVGSFASAEAAHAAYLEAKRRLHGGCMI